MGLIADISAAALFLLSSDTRDWLRSHYLAITVIALLLIAAIIALLNLLLSHRDRIGELEVELRGLNSQLTAPTEHDIEMLKAVNSQISPQSGILLWIREGFLITRVPVNHFHALERAVQFFEREPRGFDDREVEAAYRRFLDAARTLVNKISDHMWIMDQNVNWFAIPQEWDRDQPERRDRATEEISTAHDSFMNSYDSFFLVVQRKRMKSTITATEI
ncbi:hypothetical protein [Streptomyces sp. NBC_00343]|uniref:hypothetical protein n=1 Tax=Streptomyces sp. NBC_00343 TaxID=2975719 RepID=UPI002E2D41E9|nr:hypothetical protein [Streptomyces sp. NBC_00343]